MSAVLIMAIIFGGLVLCLAVVGGTVLMAIRLRHGGVSREARAREAGMIQEIYRGMARLEARVEALETLLMDPQEKEEPNR